MLFTKLMQNRHSEILETNMNQPRLISTALSIVLTPKCLQQLLFHVTQQHTYDGCRWYDDECIL